MTVSSPAHSDPEDLTGLDQLSDADLAAALVTRAGQLASRMREDGLEAEQKTSVSDLVTAADRAAEALVTTALATLRGHDGLVGEEGSRRESTSGRRWVVDPVDGTYNFFSGFAYWCSAIALTTTDDDVLLGAVHHPTSAETWLGGPGLPTTRNGVPVARLEDRPLADCGLGTYVHPTTLSDPDVREVWLRVAAAVATPRMLGSSSVDLASVAGGRLGVWAQHSVLDWDWFPGKALVEGAGGVTAVVEHRGHRWHLAGNEQAVTELLAVVRGS